MRKKTINPIIHQPVKGFARFRLSAAERAMGRVMRAPDDHGGGEGGDAGNGDAGGGAADAGAGGATSGAGAAQADGGEDGQGQGAPAGGADDGGADGAGGGAGGAGGADGEGSILSDAGRGDADGKPGGEGGDGADGDGPRLTFGEGEAASEILGAPEAYDLKVPEALAAEGVTFDAEAFGAIEPVLKDLNLSNAAAQQLVNAYAEKIGPMLAARGQTAAETMGAEMRRQWATDAEAEFNGEDGNPTLTEAKGYARQAFIASGIKADSPFLSMLEESGLGNHPDMIRFVSWVGRNVGEAKADSNPGAGGAPLSLADRVYGKPDPA